MIARHSQPGTRVRMKGELTDGAPKVGHLGIIFKAIPADGYAEVKWDNWRMGIGCGEACWVVHVKHLELA